MLGGAGESHEFELHISEISDSKFAYWSLRAASQSVLANMSDLNLFDFLG